jgi:hypothetical protein
MVIYTRKKSTCNGEKIQLTKKSFQALERIVEYLNTSEGIDSLINIGETQAPESVDDLIDVLQASKTSNEVRQTEFKIFLKNRERLLRTISNY